MLSKRCAGKVPLPIRKLGTQALKVNQRERVFRPSQIAACPIKDRSRSNKVLARLMMKSDGQLNQALQMSAPNASTKQGSPNVLQHLVCVEEMGAVEESDATFQIVTIAARFRHSEGATESAFVEIYSFPYNSRCQCSNKAYGQCCRSI
jgi:hypothetical protein